MESSCAPLRRLEQLNAVGAALAKERDCSRLLESILVAAKTITHTDGGTLYRTTEDGLALFLPDAKLSQNSAGCAESSHVKPMTGCRTTRVSRYLAASIAWT